MSRYIEQCKKCLHYQVCAEVMKNQLMIREKMLHEENAKCEHFFPAADVVVVVRCKECKYRGSRLNVPIGVRYSCNAHILPYCKPNDYCSYGEEMDGETND